MNKKSRDIYNTFSGGLVVVIAVLILILVGVGIYRFSRNKATKIVLNKNLNAASSTVQNINTQRYVTSSDIYAAPSVQIASEVAKAVEKNDNARLIALSNMGVFQISSGTVFTVLEEYLTYKKISVQKDGYSRDNPFAKKEGWVETKRIISD